MVGNMLLKDLALIGIKRTLVADAEAIAHHRVCHKYPVIIVERVTNLSAGS